MTSPPPCPHPVPGHNIEFVVHHVPSRVGQGSRVAGAAAVAGVGFRSCARCRGIEPSGRRRRRRCRARWQEGQAPPGPLWAPQPPVPVRVSRDAVRFAVRRRPWQWRVGPGRVPVVWNRRASGCFVCAVRGRCTDTRPADVTLCVVRVVVGGGAAVVVVGGGGATGDAPFLGCRRCWRCVCAVRATCRNRARRVCTGSVWTPTTPGILSPCLGC